jgi:hypothetical protein
MLYIKKPKRQKGVMKIFNSHGANKDNKGEQRIDEKIKNKKK